MEQKRPWLAELRQFVRGDQKNVQSTATHLVSSADKTDKSLDPAEELAWRVTVLRARIADRGPIWPPKIRQTPLTDTPGHCTMCGDQLTPDRAQSPWRRCSACVKALWIACNETREGVASSET